uniref:Uncharacterized protein n=1 Tax=Rhizophora mucronata TaxID=61149 RepID=A0A2P2PAQ2_RHIMU
MGYPRKGYLLYIAFHDVKLFVRSIFIKKRGKRKLAATFIQLSINF